MREKTISFMCIVIALIHFVPLSGFVGAAQLESLYGISITSPDLEILMRHRAVLFGILGGVFAIAAFKPIYQPIAFVIAACTLLPFFYLVAISENYNESIAGIVVGDIVALIALIIAVLLRFSAKQSI